MAWVEGGSSIWAGGSLPRRRESWPTCASETAPGASQGAEAKIEAEVCLDLCTKCVAKERSELHKS